MLPTGKSPIHALVAPWFFSVEAPHPAHSQAMREALFTAAVQEIQVQFQHGTAYDPLLDHRFRWAVQHLELIERTRSRVEPDAHTLAAMLFTPAPTLSRKELAAGTQP